MARPSLLKSAAPAAPLLKVADYLSRPQQFLAVAQARAGLREAIEASGQRSVVLTNNGEPQAAIVPFEALETMRGALLQLLVGEMQDSFSRLQQQLSNEQKDQPGEHPQPEPTSEAELEALVKQARGQSRGQSRAKAAAREKNRR